MLTFPFPRPIIYDVCARGLTGLKKRSLGVRKWARSTLADLPVYLRLTQVQWESEFKHL
jgi:hypothetical protein